MTFELLKDAADIEIENNCGEKPSDQCLSVYNIYLPDNVRIVYDSEKIKNKNMKVNTKKTKEVKKQCSLCAATFEVWLDNSKLSEERREKMDVRK